MANKETYIDLKRKIRFIEDKFEYASDVVSGFQNLTGMDSNEFLDTLVEVKNFDNYFIHDICEVWKIDEEVYKIFFNNSVPVAKTKNGNFLWLKLTNGTNIEDPAYVLAKYKLMQETIY